MGVGEADAQLAGVPPPGRQVTEQPAEHPAVGAVRAAAEQLAVRLGEAVDAGIGPAVLLPELVKVFRASGLPVPGNVTL